MMSPYIGEWHESVAKINGESRIQRLQFESLSHYILIVHPFPLETAFPHLVYRTLCGLWVVGSTSCPPPTQQNFLIKMKIFLENQKNFQGSY